MTIKDLNQTPSSPGCEDVEERHRRHEEREADRSAQRDRELWCLPFDEWPSEYQRDLEFEMEGRSKATDGESAVDEYFVPPPAPADPSSSDGGAIQAVV